MTVLDLSRGMISHGDTSSVLWEKHKYLTHPPTLPHKADFYSSPKDKIRPSRDISLSLLPVLLRLLLLPVGWAEMKMTPAVHQSASVSISIKMLLLPVRSCQSSLLIRHTENPPSRHMYNLLVTPNCEKHGEFSRQSVSVCVHCDWYCNVTIMALG